MGRMIKNRGLVTMAALAALAGGVPQAALGQNSPPGPTKPKGAVWANCGFDGEDGAYHLTPAFRANDIGGSWTEWDWYKKFEAETKAARSSSLSCKFHETREKIEAYRQEDLDYYQGVRNVVTLSPPVDVGFKGAPPPVAPSLSTPNSKPTAPSSRGSLTIKTDTSLRDAGKAWDAQARDQLRKDAEGRARATAVAARARAETQAEMTRFLADLKKRGRAQ